MRVVYADDALLALDKPAGLLAVPGRGADKQDCMAARVQAQWPDARVVHRLDMATSGLMLFARGAAMQRRLSRSFESRQVAKHYVAVVDGAMSVASGRIELPLAADWPRRPLQKVDTVQGKPSRTDWQVLEFDALRGLTRLALQPHTGRTHQLRLHLSAIGHPILGDMLYAPPGVQQRAARLLLHASALALDHPASGQPLHLRCEAPF
ncbi:MAG TPA: pseudouridine synthase [Rubrivivax sp.]|jgi:tRNA pseudouridine32 synthase/23S rRNA pseudouridine746 synthase|nr:pseudouridine synthase [Rubrivivax sp.]